MAASDHTATPKLGRGLLITFEGPDGSGKSTLALGVREFLSAQGLRPVGLFREPGKSPAGLRIRELSKSGRDGITPEQELDLFLEDRRWDIEHNIGPILAQRGIVLLDRYYHSSIAYQGARGLDPSEVRRCNEAFAPKPDLVVLVQLDVNACLERICKSRGGAPDLFEQRDSLERVIALFDGMTDPEIQRFDGACSQVDLQAEVNSAVQALVASHIA